jgi:beta-mannosidase
MCIITTSLDILNLDNFLRSKYFITQLELNYNSNLNIFILLLYYFFEECFLFRTFDIWELIEIARIKKISLNGNWTLINEGKELDLPAQVPGSVYIDLMNNGFIGDPFYADNKSKMQWIWESNWIYEKEFEVGSEILKKRYIKINFYGIDTIADIFLNEILLGKVNNMFLMYEYDVKDYLKKGINSLKIKFYSPTKEAKNLIEKFKYKLINFNKTPGVPYLRKAQYSLGWDVAPFLPDIGIWKDVELIAYNNHKIDTISYHSQFQYNKDPYKIIKNDEFASFKVESVNLNIKVQLISSLDNVESESLQIRSELIDPKGKKLKKKSKIKEKTIQIDYILSNPYLWWTNDLGVANLYQLNIFLEKDGEIFDQFSQRIGLKDLRLVKNSDEYGETFYFILNGIPIFAKGSNWIPIDMFIARGRTQGNYEKALNAIAEANTNMLRVWGGGIYEEDIFYDLCDELGILVWQDFMFACAVYPPFDEFNDNIKREAIYNIKRLRNHPSLALWCGNNEVEMYFDLELAISQIEDEEQKRLFKKYYIKLFEEILPNLTKKYDPNRPYWPSSPSNGSIEKNSGFPGSLSPNQGDMHYYGVWHYKEPIEKYREYIPRFMSEFGLVSHATYKTIKSYCPEDQLEFKSSIMEYHNTDKTGKNRKIRKYIKRRFQFPKQFKNQVILSQIMNGDGLKYSIEYWRRHRKNYRCMGALYWQTNDCFPGTSWGTIDYYSRWKASHYIIKRLYNPLFIAMNKNSDNIELWGINDFKDSKKCILNWKILESSGKIILENKKEINLSSCGSQLLESINKEDVGGNSNNFADKIIFYSLEKKDDKENLYYRDFDLFEAPKSFPLNNPDLSYKILNCNPLDADKFQYEIEIRSKKIAIYVYLDSETLDFVASDNFFSMEPMSSYKVKLWVSKSLITDKDNLCEDLNNHIQVYSLYNLRN